MTVKYTATEVQTALRDSGRDGSGLEYMKLDDIHTVKLNGEPVEFAKVAERLGDYNEDGYGADV
jgi:hypothetical protein